VPNLTNHNSKLRADAIRPYENSKLLLPLLLMLLALAACDSGKPSPLTLTPTPLTLTPAPPTLTPDPALGGKLAFYETSSSGTLDLYAMNASGSILKQLTAGLKTQGEPKWSADGNSILFVAEPYSNTQQIHIIRLAAGAARAVNLSNNSYDETFPDWSPDSSRIAFASNRSGGYQVYTMKPDGSDVQPLTLSQNYGYSGWPAWSPDGKRIAYTAGGVPEQTELYVINADGSNVQQLTHYNTLVARPLWSPDGSKIVFTYQKGVADQARYNVYIINADGSGQRALTTGDTIDRNPSWSPDGKRVAFNSNLSDNRTDEVFTINPDATGIAQLTNGGGLYPHYNPDGKYIVYARRPAPGQPHQLFVMNADGSNPRQLTVDEADHSFPTWGR
jgi:Tol biopolymer transport system component